MKRKNHKIFFIFLLFLISIASYSAEKASFADNLSINIIKKTYNNSGNIFRPYYLYISKRYDGQKKVPLLILFHDNDSNALNLLRTSRLSEKSDSSGFMILIPQFNKSWNKKSETEYLNKIIKKTINTYHINDNIYAVGFGNGTNILFSTLPKINTITIKKTFTINGEIIDNNIYLDRSCHITTMDYPDYNEDLYSKNLQNLIKITRSTNNLYELDTKKGVLISKYENSKNKVSLEMFKLKKQGYHWPGGIPFRLTFKYGLNINTFNATDYIIKFFDL